MERGLRKRSGAASAPEAEMGGRGRAGAPNRPCFAPPGPEVSASGAVDVLAFPAAQLLDVTGPMQVFASANDLLPGRACYRVRVVAACGGAVETSSGLRIGAEELPAICPGTLVVAGGPGVDAAASDPALLAWLRLRAAEARRVASVCTGAFLLAAAGLLDGRRAVTHWSFCDELARRHPAIHVEPDPIFVRDGPVWTSAGVTAGIDLALALVEEDHGRDAALAVARYLVVFLQRPGGQAQFSTALSLQAAGGDRFTGLHDWVRAHLADDLSLPVLARRAGMSARSFSRRYAGATGLTPARAVERLRLEAARTLLADGRLPVKRVAQRCGFGSGETMRRSFLRLLATTPADYRARFGRAGD